MDVKISPVDRQARKAAIMAREEKRAARAERAQKREVRRTNKRNSVVAKRLRRRIEKEVRTDLLSEKKHYLAGETTDVEYVIGTSTKYKGETWYRTCDYVEGILLEVLTEHAGFEYKVDHDCHRDKQRCYKISIWYTLLGR